MLRTYRVIRDAASVISEAAESTTKDLYERLVEQEPAFTDRMLGRIAHAMDGYESKGIVWKAKTLTDRGPGAQEARYGADFVGVLDVKLYDYQIQKGFLAQAKLLKPMSHAELDRMKSQCDQMLSITPDSFVFVYSIDGIEIVPASAVVASRIFSLDELYSRSVGRFFEEHFESFVGDRRIKAAKIENLEVLAAEYRARSALLLMARSSALGFE